LLRIILISISVVLIPFVNGSSIGSPYPLHPLSAFPNLGVCESIIRDVGKQLVASEHIVFFNVIALPVEGLPNSRVKRYKCYQLTPVTVAVEVRCDNEAMQEYTGKVDMDSIEVEYDNCVNMHQKVTEGAKFKVQSRVMKAKGVPAFNFCFRPEIVESISKPMACPYPVSEYKFLEKDFTFKIKGNQTTTTIYPNVGQFTELMRRNHSSTIGDDYDYYDHQNDYY